ncbi:MAG: ATP-dependent RecD-like DNA helicase, partial [Mailhella sp.]|nr:ATP-dependent RecD-like DNA helicase [Mailhella sp.]
MEQMHMLTDGAGDGLEEFSGTLERVVYHNEDNGWTVFRLRMEQREDPVAVVGSMGTPQPGVRLRLTGRWISHPKFGRQIQMHSWVEERPATEEGIRLFLASGCIKGIGPKWADRIVDHFGAQTLDVMDKEPDRMLELPRFGKKRLEAMKASWAEHQGI